MDIGQGIFAVKLYELERAYGQMQSRLQICQRKDHAEILREIQRLKEEWAETNLLLQKNTEGCRSPGVAELSAAQLAYRRQVEQNVPTISGDKLEERGEGAALYAEYAIDFATQAMKHALLAALTAIDLQMELEEEQKGGIN